MLRTAIALAIVCLTASAGIARDLCIQIDSGFYAGSALVLKKAKITRRSVAPVQGYLARYVAGTFTFFTPLYGQSVTSTSGRVAFGITFQNASLSPSGSTNGSGEPRSISMTCTPATGTTTIRPPDSCSTFIDGTSVSAHVVDCVPETAIP